MTLTKAELADMLFEKVGLNKREAKDMVEAFFEEIRITARRVVTFHASQKLKALVEEAHGGSGQEQQG
jgi:integration host factor subunit alpha